MPVAYILFLLPLLLFDTICLLSCTHGRYGYLARAFEDGRWRQGVMFFCVCLALLDFSSQGPGLFSISFSHTNGIFFLAGVERNMRGYKDLAGPE